jgi:hypothetical protein
VIAFLGAQNLASFMRAGGELLKNKQVFAKPAANNAVFTITYRSN